MQEKYPIKLIDRTIIYIDFLFLDNFQIKELLSILNKEFLLNTKTISFCDEEDIVALEQRIGKKNLINAEKYTLTNKEITCEVTPYYLKLIWIKYNEIKNNELINKIEELIHRDSIQITNISLNNNLVILFNNFETMKKNVKFDLGKNHYQNDFYDKLESRFFYDDIDVFLKQEITPSFYNNEDSLGLNINVCLNYNIRYSNNKKEILKILEELYTSKKSILDDNSFMEE